MSAKERLVYLSKYGKAFLTLIHLRGHIMIYLGDYTDAKGNTFPLSYQNIWGLSPQDRSRQ